MYSSFRACLSWVKITCFVYCLASSTYKAYPIEKFINHYSEENIIVVRALFQGATTNYFDVSTQWKIEEVLVGDFDLQSVTLCSSSLIDSKIYQDAILLLNPTVGVGAKLNESIDLNPKFSILEDTEVMRNSIAGMGVDAVLQRMKGDVKPITLKEAIRVADEFVFHEDSQCNKDNYEHLYEDRMLFGWDISFQHKFEGARPQEFLQYIYIDDKSQITYVDPCLLGSTGFSIKKARNIIEQINSKKSELNERKQNSKNN